jgi:hypothetical protein
LPGFNKLFFYDITGQLITTKENLITNNSVNNFDSPINGVYYVAIENMNPLNNNAWIYEFDVFATPIPVPNNPINLVAIGGNAKVDLSWTAVTGANNYNVKRSLIPGGPYTTVASNVYGTTYTDTDVVNGTTYYYVVTALNESGESGNSNEASATPQGTVTPPDDGNNALLVITLVSGLEKEYDLPMSQVNDFINWYNGRAAGTGAEVYTINKSFNKANFLSRKDYIAFSKIETFEVNEYTPEP